MSLSKYIEELKADCVVDEINLKESALILPAKKAKWVARLILQKNILNKLEKDKKELLNCLMERLKQESVTSLSTAVLKNSAEKDGSIVEIDQKIEESKNLIDFLERIEKIMSSMSFDIGNIIKIVQLEMT
jgi:predicted phage-related endonuclease